VLYDHGRVTVKDLTDAVTEAGYHVGGFTQRQHAPDPAGQSSPAREQ